MALQKKEMMQKQKGQIISLECEWIILFPSKGKLSENTLHRGFPFPEMVSIDFLYWSMMAGYFRRALLWNWLWIICQLNSFPRNPQSLIKRSSSKFVHMLARIEIPFPVFLPNPGLMSAKQINNSTSVGNAEKRVKNNLNKKIMKMNYKTVFFPKRSTTNHLLPLNNLVKKQFSWIYVSLPFVLCDRCAWIPEKQFPTASLGIPNTCRKIPAFGNNIVDCLEQWFESIPSWK